MSSLPPPSPSPPPRPKVKYNFWRGHPNQSLLPLLDVQKIFTSAQGNSDEGQQERLRKSLTYLPSDAGDPELLRLIGEFQDRHTAEDNFGGNAATNLAPLSLFMTSGVSHAVELLVATLTKPGDVVWMERPTYFLIENIFTNHGLNVQSLPMLADGGIDMESLSIQFQNGNAPRMIYIIPTHQNPTARTMTIEDRKKLVDLCLRYGVVLAADEVYHLLDWRNVQNDGPRPARMSVVAQHYLASHQDLKFDLNLRPGTICSVSSFTKIFAPGVRCGWVEVVDMKDLAVPQANVIDSLIDYGYIRSQGGIVPFIGEIMRIALQDGHVDASLSRLVSAYRERTRILVDALTTDRARKLWTIDTVPVGGYFLWITFLPEQIHDASKLLEYCTERGVSFLPGYRCDCFNGSVDGMDEAAAKCKRSARLCFADLDVKDLQEGADLLVECVEDYIAGNVDTS